MEVKIETSSSLLEEIQIFDGVGLQAWESLSVLSHKSLQLMESLVNHVDNHPQAAALMAETYPDTLSTREMIASLVYTRKIAEEAFKKIGAQAAAIKWSTLKLLSNDSRTKAHVKRQEDGQTSCRQLLGEAQSYAQLLLADWLPEREAAPGGASTSPSPIARQCGSDKWLPVSFHVYGISNCTCESKLPQWCKYGAKNNVASTLKKGYNRCKGCGAIRHVNIHHKDPRFVPLVEYTTGKRKPTASPHPPALPAHVPHAQLQAARGQLAAQAQEAWEAAEAELRPEGAAWESQRRKRRAYSSEFEFESQSELSIQDVRSPRRGGPRSPAPEERARSESSCDVDSIRSIPLQFGRGSVGGACSLDHEGREAEPACALEWEHRTHCSWGQQSPPEEDLEGRPGLDLGLGVDHLALGGEEEGSFDSWQEMLGVGAGPLVPLEEWGQEWWLPHSTESFQALRTLLHDHQEDAEGVADLAEADAPPAFESDDSGSVVQIGE